MTNLTKKKRLFVLSVLLCFLVFFNGFFAINQFNSNNSNLSNIIEAENPNQLNKDGILHTADYSVDYQSDGKDLNITLHQSIVNEGNPLYEITDFDSIANRSFEIDSPSDTSFNSSYTEIEVEDIYAPNKTLEFESFYSDAQSNLGSGRYFGSFYANSSCILTNASFLIYNEYSGIIIRIFLLNSTSSGEPYTPSGGDFSPFVIDTFQPQAYASGNLWYNIDFPDQLLNNSLTHNKLWYIGLTRYVGADDTYWKSGFDSNDNIDRSESYRYSGGTYSTLDVDFRCDIKLAPINESGLIDNTPEPESIGMEINGTAVNNGVKNSGTWTNTSALPSLNNQLNFTLDADWWDVQCNITKIQVNYTKTDLFGITNFTLIKNAVNVNWLSDVNNAIDSYDSRFEHFYMNFTVPATWSSLKIFNGSTDQKNIDNTGSIINGYQDISTFSAGNGTEWFLNATSPNFISSINIYDVGLNPITAANYSDVVYINATFDSTLDSSQGNDMGVNVSVYSPQALNNLLNFTAINTTFSKDEIELGNWDLSDSVLEYGIYRVQMFWHNDTAAGFNETLFTIYGETETIPTIPKTTFDVTETFNITILFNDTGRDLTIDGADISYSVEGNPSRTDKITPIGNGEYNITIDCNDVNFSGYGQKTIEVYTKKDYYNNQSDSFDITIMAPTLLDVTLDPTTYLSTEIFNITVQYNDTYLDKGIPLADINYTLNGVEWRFDNVEYFGQGKYNITVDANDTEFGSYGIFDITINASRQYYHEKSDSSLQITITGVDSLSIETPSTGSQFYSTELFNITVYFEDGSRNQGIDDADIEVEVGGSSYTPLDIDPLTDGRYNITVNCSDSIFNTYGQFSITILANKTNYDNSTAQLDITVIGNSSLSVLYPATGAYYGPTGTFNITISYTDIVKNQGIAGADLIEYSIDGRPYKSDYIFEIGSGQYNITIDIQDVNFTGYGPKTIPISINKTFYHNTTTSYSFNREVSTIISPSNTMNLGSIFRGDNASYSFFYNQTTGESIEGANWNIINDEAGFGGTYLKDNGNGNYTLHLNSTGVFAQPMAYSFIFNISAPGNETQIITLTITVLLPETAIIGQDDNLIGNIVPLGNNLTLTFNFTDQHKDKPIDILDTDNITVILVSELGNFDWYEVVNGTNGDFVHFQNGGWELVTNYGNNYTLIISTYGLTPGKLYSIIITISYTSPNPGPYNNSIIELDFFYGNAGGVSETSGGGGGGGGSTSVTGIPFETLVLYIIIIAAVVGTIAAIVGIQKGVIAPKKREKERILREVTTIFDDAINLEHILVIYKESGTCVFFKSYGIEEIDPELISGFLSAVSSFGREMDSQEALNEIQYGDKMLLLADGEFIRVALVLNKQASIILRQHLKEFIEMYEEKYARSLPDWRGKLADFRDSGELIDRVFSTSIILPHQVNYDAGKVKALKNPHSRDVLKVANALIKDSEKQYFFIATLLVEATDRTGKEKAEVFMGIKELRDTNILAPIEISAIEKPLITKQELDLIRQQICELPGLSEEDIDDLVKSLAQMGPAEREAYLASCREQAAVVSAPIKTKAETGTGLIDSVKTAKKEIKNLKKLANNALKGRESQKAIEIYNNAAVIATNWDLTKEFEELEDVIRLTTINDLKGKLKVLESEAKLAAKAGDYNEATQKYSLAARAASEIFKLGITEMTKEVKRLTNKSKEYEKLS